MAAKMGTTVDLISEGRWGLNVVAGWMQSEYELFGQQMAPHADRYAFAQAWVELVKRLWTEDDEFDFESEYFRTKGAISIPKPMQRPLPAIMNARLSPAGQKFAVNNADMIFINLGDVAGTEKTIANVRKMAAEAGRRVAIWGNVHIVFAGPKKRLVSTSPTTSMPTATTRPPAGLPPRCWAATPPPKLSGRPTRICCGPWLQPLATFRSSARPSRLWPACKSYPSWASTV